jgi:hypothetical protein
MKIALASWLLLCSCAVFAQDTVRPAKVGDVHTYAVEMKADRARYDETITVTSTDGGNIRTRHVRSDREGASTEGLYTAEWAAIKSGSTGSQLDPPVIQAPRPLQVGTSAPIDSLALVANGARVRFKGDASIVAQEKLSTPAGEFDVYRIEQKGYINGVSFQGGFGFTQRIWYAPSIDRMVRMEYKEQRTMGADNVWVLKSFKAAD